MPDFNADLVNYLRRQRLQEALLNSQSSPDVSAPVTPPVPLGGPTTTTGVPAITLEGSVSPPNTQVPALSATFQPPAIGPEETRFRQMQSQTPLKSDFHPGKLRQILATISGLGTGFATSDPAKAGQASESFKDYPFTHKLQDFQQGLGVQQAKSEQEIGDVQRAATQAHLAAQSQAEEARRQAEVARGKRFEFLISDKAHQQKLEELAVQHPGSSVFHEARFKDQSIHYLKRNDQGRLIDTETNSPVSMDAIDQLSDPNKSLKETKEANMPAALAGSIKAREILANRDKYDQPTVDAAGEYIKNLEQGKDPKTAFDAVKDKRAEELGRPLTSAELTKISKDLQPEQKPPQALMVDPSTNKMINARPGVVLPPGSISATQFGQENVTTAATKTMREAAPKVIDLANKVKQGIDDQIKSLGPSAGRWNEFMAGKVGAPNPEFTTLRTNVGLLQTLLMRMHLGSRGGQMMFSHFKDLIDVGKQSPENLKAAADAIIDYANDIGKLPSEKEGPQIQEEYVRDPVTKKLVLKK